MEVYTPAMPPQARPLQTSYRIDSIDLLRGLVMIIMALDHTRDYFHAPALLPGHDPTNLDSTTPLLFFTRWITHFCAPVFVFLAGASAFFQSLRKSKKELSRFLITRGIWLILVEIFIVTLVITFDVFYTSIFLQTIWAIGISMVVLGLAIWLPFPLILATGLLIVFGHNLLDFYEEGKRSQSLGFFYDLMHRPNFFPFGNGRILGALYPFLPWTGLMLMGYCFGKIFSVFPDNNQRKKVLAWLGIIVILIFISIRATNEYGDARDWSVQKNGLFTVMSFINTTKYPPSLLYICMTIGPALLFLAFAGKTKTALARIITVYGRVPFLYYVVHFFLLHLITSILFLARGHSFSEGLNGVPGTPPLPFKFLQAGEGYSLGIVFLIWLLAVAALYPVCKWFSDYKKTHKQWWLSYL